MRQTARLSAAERQQLRDEFEQDAFCAELIDPVPMCPEVFDADAVLTVESNNATYEDRFAGGCVVATQELPNPPYRGRDLARTHFPGVLLE